MSNNKQSKAKPKPKYKVTIEIAGKTYKYRAKDIKTAIEKIALTWDKIKNKAIVTVEYKDRKHTHIFTAQKMKLIYTNKITRAMWAQRLNLLLGLK